MTLNSHFISFSAALKCPRVMALRFSAKTDALAEDIITVCDAFVAVSTCRFKFNCKMVAVDQALKQATDMVERPRTGDSSLATVASPTTEENLDDLEIPVMNSCILLVLYVPCHCSSHVACHILYDVPTGTHSVCAVTSELTLICMILHQFYCIYSLPSL